MEPPHEGAWSEAPCRCHSYSTLVPQTLPQRLIRRSLSGPQGARQEQQRKTSLQEPQKQFFRPHSGNYTPPPGVFKGKPPSGSKPVFRIGGKISNQFLPPQGSRFSFQPRQQEEGFFFSFRSLHDDERVDVMDPEDEFSSNHFNHGFRRRKITRHKSIPLTLSPKDLFGAKGTRNKLSPVRESAGNLTATDSSGSSSPSTPTNSVFIPVNWIIFFFYFIFESDLLWMKEDIRTPVLKSEKNVPKIPLAVLKMYCHEIGHYSIQNLKLYVPDRYVGGWSEANTWMHTMIQFLANINILTIFFLGAVGLGKD